MNTADGGASKRSLTPTKRPHVVDPLSHGSQNSFTVSSDLSEPDTKRRKNINDKELEAERAKELLRQMWCDKHFVVSKLDGHNDVICSLDCNQDVLLTGRLVM